MRYVQASYKRSTPLASALAGQTGPYIGTAPPPAYRPNAAGVNVNAQGYADPNDPALAAKLRGLNPSGTSTFGAAPGTDFSGVPGANGGPSQGAPTQKGWEDDPILAQIRGLSTRNIADAESGATAARQQALLAYGYDPALSGEYGDTATAQAAQQNPFSTLAQLMQQHTTRAHNTDETLNQGNLFYSGARGQAIGDESRQYLGEQASAQSDLQSKLGAISTSLLAARHAEDERQVQAAQDAYDRYLQFHEDNNIPADPTDTPPDPNADGGGGPGVPQATRTAVASTPAARASAAALAASRKSGASPAAAALAARSAALNALYAKQIAAARKGRR